MKQPQQTAAEAANETNEEDAVHLKPLWGIRPGVYLAALDGAIILTILFFALFWPGLSRPGSVLMVSSDPWGAAVRIDDAYYAAAPARIFVSKGTHTVTAVLPGFEPFSQQINVTSRIFASRFFPKKMRLAVRLTETAPRAALTLGAADYAAWSFAGEPTIDYQIPLSLSEGVYRSAANLAEAKETFQAAARFMVTQAAAKDLLRAEFLAAGGGSASSPLTLLDAARDVFSYLQNNREFVVALAELRSGEAARALVDSKLYPEVWNSPSSNLAFTVPRTGAPLTIETIPFTAELLPNTFIQAANFQHERSVGPFAISLSAISYNQWQRFLAETPRWRLEERNGLIAQGLVTADYIEPVASYREPAAFYAEYPAYPEPAMSGVSWYAAEAFCQWLTAKLPASLQHYEARLPTEAEWEYAARFAELASSDPAAPRGMVWQSSGLWEWCADFFAPLNYLDAPPGAIAALSSPERSVRGSSWAAAQELGGIQRRASLPPDSCSAFTGFRVVIAPRPPERP